MTGIPRPLRVVVNLDPPLVKAVEVIAAAMQLEAAAMWRIAQAVCSPLPPGEVAGHFEGLHVTEVIYPPKETIMPPIDHTPPLDLASSSVRAKLSVVNPRLPDGSRVAIGFEHWSTDDTTELPLEAAPDDTVKDENGIDVLDPVDNLPLNIYSVFGNTPLTPTEGTKADGTVTCSYPGMASIDKLVRYGDAPLGHFTMVATEAPEA